MIYMNRHAARKRNLLIVIAACVFSFSISAGVRLIEYPKWNQPEMKAGGEYILATHDAYAWVSGASGLNESTAGSVMANFLRTVASIFRTSPANVAFWSPAFLASLVTIPLVLWSGLIRAPNFAVLIAIVGALVPAYYTRTRLGYFDTDWAALFFPLMIGLLLAIWLRPHLRIRNGANQPDFRDRAFIWVPIATVLLITIGMPWHSFVPIYVVASMWIAAGLIVFATGAERRKVMIWILIGIASAALSGWIGALIGIALVLFVVNREEIRSRRWVEGLGFVILSAVLIGLVIAQTDPAFVERLLRYTDLIPRGLAIETSNVSLSFPPSAISIAELQSTTAIDALKGMAYFWWLGALGVTLFCFLLWREPVALLLAPLVLMGFASVQLGSRFAFFGGAVLIMAALAPIEWFVRRRRDFHLRYRMAVLGFPILAALIAAFLISKEYEGLPVRPVVHKEHAEALLELRDVSNGVGMVWTWWDYGFATQYYAGSDTFADGGRNTGPYLFTLANVLTAADPAVARNLVQLSVNSEYRPWELMESQGLDAFYEEVISSASTYPVPLNVAPQYVVVQWEAFSSLPWITFYGSWDFDTMTGQRAYVAYLAQPPEIDMNEGVLVLPGEPIVRLSTLDVIEFEGTKHYEFEQGRDGFHLLINSDAGEAFLLDGRAYYSTFVQLLIRSPDELKSVHEFELAIDRSPHIRIFQIN